MTGPPLLALSLLAAGLLITGCTPATPSSSSWESDVHYNALTAGTCLQFSYQEGLRVKDVAFNANASDFHAVDCATRHFGIVLGVVEIPASTQWAEYGTTSGPDGEEAQNRLTDVCRSFDLLLRAYLDSRDDSTDIEVRPNYPFLSEARLGTCIAHLTGTRDGKVVDLDLPDLDLAAMEDFANAVRDFSDDLPGELAGWGDGSTARSTPWYQLRAGACVESFPGIREAAYNEISCLQSHAAQVLSWVPMPTEWNEEYRGDEDAAAVVDAACSQLESSLNNIGLPDAITVESGLVGENYIVHKRYLAQCWGYRSDGENLTAKISNSVEWYDIPLGGCVGSYLGPDEASYEVVDCRTAHAAEFLAWADMPAEWNGVFAGDAEANAVASDFCTGLQAAYDPTLGVIVESSDASSEFVIVDEQTGVSHLTQCWARPEDSSTIWTTPLSSLG